MNPWNDKPKACKECMNARVITSVRRGLIIMNDNDLLAFCRRGHWNGKTPRLFTIFRKQFRHNSRFCLDFEADA